MPNEVLTFWEYVKAAFRYQPRIPLLGKMPLNPMLLAAFALLGLFNPGFWFIGGAFELVYLTLRSANARFQKIVEGERLLARQQGHDHKIQSLASGLSKDSAARYRKLVDQCGDILGIETTAGELGVLRDMRGGSLNQLLWLFLRLLTSRELIVRTLGQVDPRRLEADIARLKERLAGAEQGSALARSLQGTHDIQTKRLDNLTKSRGNLEVIEAELVRIEQQVQLLKEESAAAGGPEFISSRIDAVTSTLTETTQWMDQHAEFFSSLGAEEPLGSAVPAKPPAAPQKQG